ncbi:MAG: DUF4339 domain-containing protein [Planctomycetaceae bacterium]|jgi:hypothetical protein|nr:DUF4339 domain-containing protein [Planctomycetaceae bacterium]
MGIRFFCPNGHKLHVKSHLAGLKGYCPECGVELVVPLASTRKSSKEGGEPINNTDAKTQSQNKSNQNQNPHPDIISMFGDSANESAVISQNPILQDQSIDWYIYNAENGNQQGPLKGQAVQKLIQLRQIKPQFFVWREGLKDWVLASSIFPELGSR